MPLKDAGKTVLKAINSILNQSLADLELIVVDDHSKDKSSYIINAIDDTRIKILKNKGHGITRALNMGMAYARGEYIARMDADDYSYPHRLQTQLQFALANPNVNVISCLVNHSNTSDNQGGYRRYVEWLNGIQTIDDHYSNRFADSVVAHPTVFFLKKLIKKHGLYSTKAVPEDYELWLRWMDQGVTFAKVPEFLLDWSDYPERLSRTHNNYRSEKFFEIKASYFRRWYEKQSIKSQVWVWGYGQKVFKKAQFFMDTRICIEGYIDLQPRPKARRNVISIKDLDPQPFQLFLILIGDWNGKKTIETYFNQRNLIPGKDYFFMN